MDTARSRLQYNTVVVEVVQLVTNHGQPRKSVWSAKGSLTNAPCCIARDDR